jgi:hypothetical protein
MGWAANCLALARPARGQKRVPDAHAAVPRSVRASQRAGGRAGRRALGGRAWQGARPSRRQALYLPTGRCIRPPAAARSVATANATNTNNPKYDAGAAGKLVHEQHHHRGRMGRRTRPGRRIGAAIALLVSLVSAVQASWSDGAARQPASRRAGVQRATRDETRSPRDFTANGGRRPARRGPRAAWRTAAAERSFPSWTAVRHLPTPLPARRARRSMATPKGRTGAPMVRPPRAAAARDVSIGRALVPACDASAAAAAACTPALPYSSAHLAGPASSCR